jgi:hypothetical protein
VGLELQMMMMIIIIINVCWEEKSVTDRNPTARKFRPVFASINFHKDPVKI